MEEFYRCTKEEISMQWPTELLVEMFKIYWKVLCFVNDVIVKWDIWS